MDRKNLCNSCGLRPQVGTKPIAPCKAKKKCCKKDCCKNDFVFRKVVIPAALGDDETGKDKPANGAYTNSYVEYEANGAQYMYDSYGVYTKIESGGGGEGTLDFNQLENRPKYAGERMTGDTDIPDVDVAIAGIQTQINGKQDTLTQTQLDAVNSGIDTTKVNQIATNTSGITTIEGKIPTQASSSNQLADKDFVNSSIATNTAYYISDNGQPFTSLAALEAYSGDLSNNDYAFVVGTDQQGNTTYTRYKYSADTGTWAEEYVLNNSSFTAEQWAAINSGITSGAVDKLDDLANIKSIGSNLNLDSNGELSATDTTYTDFVGTDGTSTGVSGLVPAPATTDAGKFLKADGTWDDAGGSSVNVVQDSGTSTTDVMSQRAVSRLIFRSGDEVGKSRVQIGAGAYSYNSNGSTAAIGFYSRASGSESLSVGIGTNISFPDASGSRAIVLGSGNAKATGLGAIKIGSNYGTQNAKAASGNYSIAIGNNAVSSNVNSIALGGEAAGEGSITSRTYELSIGRGTAGDSAEVTRYIAHVKDPQRVTDAANKQYVDNFYPVGTVYTSTSSTAPTFAGGTWTQIGTQTIGSSTVYYYERTA